MTAAAASNGPVSSQPNSRDIEWLSARTGMPAISNEPTRKNGIAGSEQAGGLLHDLQG